MIVMSIAGIDPSAGAGLFADIKTFQKIGVYGTGIVTSLTSQNPYKIYSLKPIESNYIAEEIDSVLEEYTEIKYIKTGMLYSEDIIKTVSGKIKEYNLKAIVDPVMVATAGGKLSKEDMGKAILKYLLPKAILTTPNIDEASKLSGINIKTEEDAIKAAEIIGKTCDVIVTGGHLDGINTIYRNNKISIIKEELIDTENLHGSGCVFSASIVAYLGLGYSMEIAIEKSFKYVHNAILNGNYGTLI
ncbi:bifunctional hydroxymethylpyrimidine kinase/phosphomethylpyrimidine kinase [Methanobrevibacter sp. OttesenSCG-928-K11]|nr:bifunctional hydroxymethylpyrimidine kinase/phosphomethylpyrimidine kinase [Methanobrevibacter sp. OttesenSCG-928-K11]MDL2270329.1 bifunctional hydroxymethylpyrimidine kinase/phosphomethylpyrimidine kinase [Methanobrevibacter sp. OttesenSCG-928-I08]